MFLGIVGYISAFALLTFPPYSKSVVQTPQPTPTYNYIKPLVELDGPGGKVSQLEFSPDEKFIASAACIKETLYACVDSKVALWNLETKPKTLTYVFGGKITQLGFKPNSQTLVILNGVDLYFWETETQPKPVLSEFKIINRFAYSDNGKYFVILDCSQERM